MIGVYMVQGLLTCGIDDLFPFLFIGQSNGVCLHVGPNISIVKFHHFNYFMTITALGNHVYLTNLLYIYLLYINLLYIYIYYIYIFIIYIILCFCVLYIIFIIYIMLYYILDIYNFCGIWHLSK